MEDINKLSALETNKILTKTQTNSTIHDEDIYSGKQPFSDEVSRGSTERNTPNLIEELAKETTNNILEKPAEEEASVLTEKGTFDSVEHVYNESTGPSIEPSNFHLTDERANGIKCKSTIKIADKSHEETTSRSTEEVTGTPTEGIKCKPTEETSCKSTEEITDKSTEETTCKSIEEITWKSPEESTCKSSEERTCKSPEERTCKSPEKRFFISPEERTCKSQEESTCKSQEESTCKSPGESTHKSLEESIFKSHKEITDEPTGEKTVLSVEKLKDRPTDENNINLLDQQATGFITTMEETIGINFTTSNDQFEVIPVTTKVTIPTDSEVAAVVLGQATKEQSSVAEEHIISTTPRSDLIITDHAVEMLTEEINLPVGVSEDNSFITIVHSVERDTVRAATETIMMATICAVDPPSENIPLLSATNSVADESLPEMQDQIQGIIDCPRNQSADVQLVSNSYLKQERTRISVLQSVNHDAPQVEEQMEESVRSEEKQSTVDNGKGEERLLAKYLKLEVSDSSKAFAKCTISSSSQSLLEENCSDTSALMKLAELACSNELNDLSVRNETLSPITPTLKTLCTSFTNDNEESLSLTKQNIAVKSLIDHAHTDEQNLDIEKFTSSNLNENKPIPLSITELCGGDVQVNSIASASSLNIAQSFTEQDTQTALKVIQDEQKCSADITEISKTLEPTEGTSTAKPNDAHKGIQRKKKRPSSLINKCNKIASCTSFTNDNAESLGLTKQNIAVKTLIDQAYTDEQNLGMEKSNSTNLTETKPIPLSITELADGDVQVNSVAITSSLNIAQSFTEQDAQATAKVIQHEQKYSADITEISKTIELNEGISTAKSHDADNGNQRGKNKRTSLISKRSKITNCDKISTIQSSYKLDINMITIPNELSKFNSEFDDIYSTEEADPLDTVCMRCRKRWNDKLLALLFEGTEPVTVNSSITNGAILCMTEYASKNNLPVDNAVKCVLDSADFGNKFGSNNITTIYQFIQKLICQQKSKCCDRFCIVDPSNATQPMKTITESDKTISIRTNNNNKSCESSTSSNRDDKSSTVTTGETSKELKYQVICNANMSLSTNFPVIKVRPPMEQTTETDLTYLEQSINIKIETWKSLSKDSIHECYKFVSVNKCNIYYIRNGSPTTKSYLINERKYLTKKLETIYNSLSYPDGYFSEVDGILTRIMSCQELISCCIMCYDARAHKYNTQLLYTLVSQMLLFRNTILLIPDGDTIIKYVTKLTTENLASENYKDGIWDENEVYSVCIIKDEIFENITIRDVIVALCRKHLGQDVYETFSSRLQSLSVQDVTGYAVRVYAMYCDLAFIEQEESKARFLLNLPATSDSSECTVAADLSIFPPQKPSSLNDYIDFYRRKLSSNFSNDFLCKENQTILLEETLKCKNAIIKFAQDQPLQTVLLAHVKETSTKRLNKRKLASLKYDKLDHFRPSKKAKIVKNKPKLKDVIASLLQEGIQHDDVHKIVEIIYRDIYKMEIPSLDKVTAVVLTNCHR